MEKPPAGGMAGGELQPPRQGRRIAGPKLRLVEFSAFLEQQRDPDSVSPLKILSKTAYRVKKKWERWLIFGRGDGCKWDIPYFAMETLILALSPTPKLRKKSHFFLPSLVNVHLTAHAQTLKIPFKHPWALQQQNCNPILELPLLALIGKIWISCLFFNWNCV